MWPYCHSLLLFELDSYKKYMGSIVEYKNERKGLTLNGKVDAAVSLLKEYYTFIDFINIHNPFFLISKLS